MIQTVAVAGFRSIQDLAMPLGRITVVTGANGSGKSNIYRALRLLSSIPSDGLAQAMTAAGGMPSLRFAGTMTPEQRVEAGIIGTPNADQSSGGGMRVRFGFAEQDFGYSVSLSVTGKDILALSPHHGWRPAFPSDPEIRNEFIWHGPVQNANSLMISRANQAVSQKNGRNWKVLRSDLQLYESIFSVGIDREVVPVIDEVGHRLRRWRFYDFFRADSQAPARQLWNGLRTPVLSEDGHDIASALHTIQATGDSDTLHAVVASAFPGCAVDVDIRPDRIYALEFWQKGLSRPLSAAELSEGTLRFLLLTAALLTTRPPRMMLFNEPESSLHPSLIAPLAELMIEVSKSTQLWVVSHSQELVEALCQFEDTRLIRLEKHMGMTQIANLHTLDRPAWSWQG